MAEVARKKQFKVGDWVNVTGPHPHRGESGHITEASNMAGSDWIVQGEWNSFYIRERDLRKA